MAHRRSVDLDLFREADFDPEQLLRELLAEGRIVQSPRSRPNTLWFEVEGVPITLMRFQYPLVERYLSARHSCFSANSILYFFQSACTAAARFSAVVASIQS